MSRRYGIDLDGVLANFGARVVQAGNTLWPGKFPPGYVPDNWNYEGYLTGDEWNKIWEYIKSTPHFWLDEGEMAGLSELLDQIRPDDEIFFVTARAVTVGDSPAVQSAQWLMARGLFPRGGHSTVLQVMDSKHKQDLFKALRIEYMLDDYGPTVQQLIDCGVKAYVLDQPWNRVYTDLPRVYSVSEYLSLLPR